MPNPNPHEVKQLLLAWSEGDKAAMDQLMPLVYGELRQLWTFRSRRFTVTGVWPDRGH